MEVEIKGKYQTGRETRPVGSSSRGSLRGYSGPKCGAREDGIRDIKTETAIRVNAESSGILVCSRSRIHLQHPELNGQGFIQGTTQKV